MSSAVQYGVAADGTADGEAVADGSEDADAVDAEIIPAKVNSRSAKVANRALRERLREVAMKYHHRPERYPPLGVASLMRSQPKLNEVGRACKVSIRLCGFPVNTSRRLKKMISLWRGRS